MDTVIPPLALHPSDIDAVVVGLRRSRDELHQRALPRAGAAVAVARGHRRDGGPADAGAFPAHFGRPDLKDRNSVSPEAIDEYVAEVLHRALAALADHLRRTLPFGPADLPTDDDVARQSLEITRRFAAGLPAIRGKLVSDLKAAYAGDPAATSISEILLVYPGMTAVIHYRLAHASHQLGARFLARQICEIAHSLTGIDIHPGAEIGASFFIDHGTGVVIGETAIIGERVRLYQAVTLGARSFPADETGALVKGRPRHPVVEDDVVIYAGATVLGRITIGRGSTIGGSVWLTHSVPPNSNVTQAQLRNDERLDRQG